MAKPTSKDEHSDFTQKPVVSKKGKPAPTVDGNTALSSTTALSEQLPNPAPALPSPEAVTSAQEQIAVLQAEYDTVAAQTKAAKSDPVTLKPLLARKGAITREIDALKRAHGL